MVVFLKIKIGKRIFTFDMNMLLNFIHWGPDPVLFSLGPIELRYYSLCWLLAIVLAYILMLRVFKKEGKSQELLDQLTIYVFIGIFLGARLGHCLFYDFAYYKDHIIEIFLPIQQVNGSWKLTGFAGLASHGAAFGTLVSLLLFSRKYKIDFMWLADRLALVVPISGAFVRLGNFFNSEMIGHPTTVPWAIIFEQHDNIPRHPGQLYEALAYILIFILLWTIYNRNIKLKKGVLFGWFLILLFGARFILEYFKIDQVGFEATMQFNMGQWLSVPFIALGVYLLIKANKKS